MNEKIFYRASLLLSSLAILLLVVNVSLTTLSRAKQAEMAQRQSEISAGQTIASLGQGLVQAINDSATKNNDAQLHALLIAQGIKAPEKK